MQYLVAGALGLGLAASSGFRVFVPLLAASVAHRMGWLPSSPGFEWLGSGTALLVLATATVAELAGYYVPFVDHLLDMLTTPASFVAGTLLMTSSLTHLDPTLRWTLGILVGGGAAGLVQGSTALLRAGSTATTGGLANPLFATFENVLAIGGTLFTLLLPLVAAGLVSSVVGTGGQPVAALAAAACGAGSFGHWGRVCVEAARYRRFTPLFYARCFLRLFTCSLRRLGARAGGRHPGAQRGHFTGRAPWAAAQWG